MGPMGPMGPYVDPLRGALSGPGPHGPGPMPHGPDPMPHGPAWAPWPLCGLDTSLVCQSTQKGLMNHTSPVWPGHKALCCFHARNTFVQTPTTFVRAGNTFRRRVLGPDGALGPHPDPGPAAGRCFRPGQRWLGFGQRCFLRGNSTRLCVQATQGLCDSSDLSEWTGTQGLCPGHTRAMGPRQGHGAWGPGHGAWGLGHGAQGPIGPHGVGPRRAPWAPWAPWGPRAP